MDAVSVENINLLLAFSGRLKSIQGKFRNGIEKMKSNAAIAISNASIKYDEIRHETEEAHEEVEYWQSEIERLDDEIESEKSYTEEDGFTDAPIELYEDLDDAKNKLADAKDNWEKAKDKEAKAKQLYGDIRMWGDRLRSLDTCIIDSEFERCGNFVNKYGSYLLDAVSNV